MPGGIRSRLLHGFALRNGSAQTRIGGGPTSSATTGAASGTLQNVFHSCCLPVDASTSHFANLWRLGCVFSRVLQNSYCFSSHVIQAKQSKLNDFGKELISDPSQWWDNRLAKVQ